MILGAFLSSLSVALMGHLFARIFRAPVSVFLVPGILPLVPGTSIYNSVYYVIRNSREEDVYKRQTYGSVILGDSGAKKMDFQDQHEDDRTPITVGFVGNPNCGKTTLFNAFTGAKLKVANWPGVTVERVEGETSYKGRPIKAVSYTHLDVYKRQRKIR